MGVHEADVSTRGGGLLARISNEMVAAQKDCFGKGPTHAKSYGRKVLTYQPQILFDPNIALEAFVLDGTDERGATQATAEGQLGDGDTGAATAENDLGDPARDGS